MDPITLVGNILGVAKSLLGITDKLQSAEQARKEKIGSLFENISDCLVGVSSEIGSGNVPHGRCNELITYAQELPDLIRADVGDQKADELGQTLHSAYNVEGMAIDLSAATDKEPYLKEIEEASGKFRALANIVRTG
jgi:hypothetical protein